MWVQAGAAITVAVRLVWGVVSGCGLGIDREFALVARGAMRVHIAPKPVLPDLLADGCFVWSDRKAEEDFAVSVYLSTARIALSLPRDRFGLGLAIGSQ